MGRKTTANDKTKQVIIEQLSAGIPLADICRADKMPATRTVSGWKAADPDFAADFARARETGHDAIAARLRNTARGFGPDRGGESTFDVQRDKLVIETDLKLLAKWDKRYGDKMAVEHSGEVTRSYDLSGLATDELDELERLVAKAADARGDTVGKGEAKSSSVH